MAKTEDEDKESNSSEIKPTRCCNWFDFIVDLLTPCLTYCCKSCTNQKACFCCRCRKNREARGIERARELMDNEINIVEIVKMLRYLYSCVRLVLS